MKRLTVNELVSHLSCPACGGILSREKTALVCASCKVDYPFFREKPVLMSRDNALFPVSAYVKDERPVAEKKPGLLRQIKRMVPGRSVNLSRARLFARIASEHGRQGKLILVVGCGNQTEQLEQYFSDQQTTFVFCDISRQADVDVFCDSHELPFKAATFDGVISTAVMEHVLYPDKVMAQIYRVLKPKGFLYSEIPFLQSVHEGAYDFTRYSLSGHRRLLEYFEEIDAGMVAGPGTALVWSLIAFSKSLTAHSRLSSMLGLLTRSLFFWLKYFDYLMKDNPRAIDSASCTYIYGNKSELQGDVMNIIRRYGK